MGSRAGLDAVAMIKSPIIAPPGNWTPVVQPIGLVSILTELPPATKFETKQFYYPPRCTECARKSDCFWNVKTSLPATLRFHTDSHRSQCSLNSPRTWECTCGNKFFHFPWNISFQKRSDVSGACCGSTVGQNGTKALKGKGTSVLHWRARSNWERNITILWKERLINWFLDYSTTSFQLHVLHTVNGRIYGNDKLERTGKNAGVTYLRHYFSICLEVLRKTKRNLVRIADRRDDQQSGVLTTWLDIQLKGKRQALCFCHTGAATDNTLVKTARRSCWAEVVGFAVCFLILLTWPPFVGRYCLPARRLVLALPNDLNDFIIRRPNPSPARTYFLPITVLRVFFFCGRVQSCNGHMRPWPKRRMCLNLSCVIYLL